MAIPKKAIGVGANTVSEVARKAYEAGFGRGFKEGAKWVGNEIAPLGGKMLNATLSNGLPNIELRTVGSKLLHICKKIKHF